MRRKSSKRSLMPPMVRLGGSPGGGRRRGGYRGGEDGREFRRSRAWDAGALEGGFAALIDLRLRSPPAFVDAVGHLVQPGAVVAAEVPHQHSRIGGRQLADGGNAEPRQALAGLGADAVDRRSPAAATPVAPRRPSPAMR